MAINNTEVTTIKSCCPLAFSIAVLSSPQSPIPKAAIILPAAMSFIAETKVNITI